MAQKTNPNILQLNKTYKWGSNYIEKTSKDFYLYAHKDLETKKFINRFFLNNGLLIQNCKLNYNNNNLTLFLSYHQNPNSIDSINSINKNQNLIIKKETLISNKDLLQKFKILKTIKNYFNYNNSIFYKNNLLKKKLFLKRINKIKRLKNISYYKKYINLKQNKVIINSFSKEFLKTLFNGLSNFYKNLNNITLILKPLNNSLNKIISFKKFLKFKKKLIKLRKYQKNSFFKESVGIAFSIITNRSSSELLSKYIAKNIGELKRHNFFLRFLETLLPIFISKSKLSIVKGIKIKIKGRINGRPRAKSKIINIGKEVPLFTIDSSVNYSETTAYTANGTLGVKVWIYEKH